MIYRTKTYIAAEWDGDYDLVERLRKWNDGEYWSLHFLDAHALGESRDSSLNCTIKRSLEDRLAHSQTFVLLVGENTLSARAGSCAYCGDYSGLYGRCRRGHSTDMRSYIEFECDYARRHIPNIVVLYNYAYVYKEKCPEALRYQGNHLPAYYWDTDGRHWRYQAIKEALDI